MSNLHRIYRYKFYLDANHAVSFNGKLGEIHPHTWEFLVELERMEHDNVILFTQIEDIINNILLPYQNKVINTVYPFDTENPTTEAIGEYFYALVEYKMEVLGWNLLRMEISESPNRTYILK